jgi:hypothetical protein
MTSPSVVQGHPLRDLPSTFELLLFGHDLQRLARSHAAGVAGAVIDWETDGKRQRQEGADTQINHDTPADLRRVRASFAGRIVCRTNPVRERQRAGQELDQAIAGGADEVLLPMVKSVAEVAWALDYARGRTGIGILVETLEAVRLAQELGRLPLTRVYVGLNDLAIARGSRHIFAAVADGTVDGLRPHFTVPFGFGGLTIVEAGCPVPCRVLMAEMVRLQCSFTFLRRSFIADIANRDPSVEVPRILAELAALRESFRERGPSSAANMDQYLLGTVGNVEANRQ